MVAAGAASHEDEVKLETKHRTTVQIPSSLLGTCTTAAATAAKVVTLTDVTDFELNKGTVIVVKFTNTNTAQNPTLNVNNTGAKSIYYNTSVISTGALGVAGIANRYIEYMYDGTNWVWISQGIDNNTTYTLADRSMDVYCETAAATAAKVGTAYYYSLKNNSKFHIRFRYANSAQSKLTLNVGGKGAKALWINGVISSSTNYTLPAGEYECVYYNNAYYLRTDSPYAFIPSHIGQIVESTMLASEDDCKKLYGFNTSWIQHSGYMLRGATSGVNAGRQSKDGGSDTVTLTGAQSGLKGHGHGFTQPTVDGGATNTGWISADHGHNLYLEYGAAGSASFPPNNNKSGYMQLGRFGPYQNLTSGVTSNHYHSQVAHTHSVSGGAVSDAGSSNATSSHSVLPNYKNVYIWERTA